VNEEDPDTDYGSDFSPEEDLIIQRLLSGKIDIEDNPIVNDIEHHDAPKTIRVPRVYGREQRSPLFEAARAAENVAGRISNSIKTADNYPDCESSSLRS